MPYKIAIASGKGGTGKTTLSVNLMTLLNETQNNKVELIDCDVEEPNDLIFFGKAEKKSELEINQLIPIIDKDNCTFCRSCVEYCEFNAIVVIPPVKFAEVNKSLCHSCGACLVACKQNAISEVHDPIGIVNSFISDNGQSIKEGRLKIGSAMQTMLIKELKKNIEPDNDIIVFDAPPGTSCPVVETVSDANYVILVTEPTLFGFHDLKLMVNLLKDLKLSFGVVVNKAGIGDQKVYNYLETEGIELLGEIPFSKEYASLYASGDILNTASDRIKDFYKKIAEKVNLKIANYERNNNSQR